MKIEMNLSERDKKLLFLLLSILILAGSYFFIYEKNISKAEELKTSNEQLQTRVDGLSQMEAQKEEKIAETETYKVQIAQMKEKFPVEVRTEDAIVMLHELEQVAGMEINSVGFTMNQLFYPAAGMDASAGTDTQAAADTGTADTSGADNAGTAGGNTADQEAGPAPLTGYESMITISYSTTYEGFKKAINYINQSANRMTLGDVTATYDSSTGNLVGSMTINMFALSGSDIDKEYIPPYVDGSIGRENIFGTAD